MNENKTTSKYIEWDLEKFKSGWPAEWHGKPAKFVAHVPEADSLCRLIFLWEGNIKMLPDTQGNNPYGSICLLAREIDPHPDNKDGLYRDQVGEGWRIKGHDEKPNPGDEVWNGARWLPRTYSELVRHCTYRTRDPLPVTKIPLGPENIILGKTVVRKTDFKARSNLVIGFSSLGIFTPACETAIPWDSLHNDHDISFDHGITWQRAEKAAKP